MAYLVKKRLRKSKHTIKVGNDIWHFKNKKEMDKFVENPHILWHYKDF